MDKREPAQDLYPFLVSQLADARADAQQSQGHVAELREQLRAHALFVVQLRKEIDHARALIARQASMIDHGQEGLTQAARDVVLAWDRIAEEPLEMLGFVQRLDALRAVLF